SSDVCSSDLETPATWLTAPAASLTPLRDNSSEPIFSTTKLASRRSSNSANSVNCARRRVTTTSSRLDASDTNTICTSCQAGWSKFTDVVSVKYPKYLLTILYGPFFDIGMVNSPFSSVVEAPSTSGTHILTPAMG